MKRSLFGVLIRRLLGIEDKPEPLWTVHPSDEAKALEWFGAGNFKVDKQCPPGKAFKLSDAPTAYRRLR